MKRIGTALLCLVLLLSVLPASLSVSAAKKYTEGDYTYTIKDGKATIVDVRSSVSGEVVVPVKLGGYTVTTIGELAFSDLEMLTAVTIPEEITTIENHAFSSCISLKEVKLPEGITCIRKHLFNYCINLKKVNLPENITSIESGAFEACYKLEKIELPKKLKTIGENAFSECESLDNLVIPEGVTTIEKTAFYYCKGMRTITLPASLKKVSSDSFVYCNQLSDVWYGGTLADRFYLKGITGELEKATWHCAKSPVTLIWDVPNVAVVGENVITTSVYALGDGLSYQWYKKDVGEKRFVKSSCKSEKYSCKMNEKRNKRKVYCVVRDQYGNTITSRTATLSMRPELKIVINPKKVTYAKNGGTAKVTVKASGDILKYTWYVKNAGAKKYTKSSVTTATYSVKMTDKVHGRRVYCVVMDSYGKTVQTSTVLLRRAATITTQPKTVTVKKNTTAKVSVKASGDGLKYTWYIKNPGQSKYSKSSVKSATYSCKMTAKISGRYVYCVVTDKYGKTVQTKTVRVKMK